MIAGAENDEKKKKKKQPTIKPHFHQKGGHLFIWKLAI